MHFLSEQRFDDIIERTFLLDGTPGWLWLPEGNSSPVPLVLLGHPGGLEDMRPRLLSRAQACVRDGLGAATIELPGSGDLPRIESLEQARVDLRRALAAGEPLDEIVDRLVLPLVDAAVPSWQKAIDSLLALPDIDGPVGLSGGVTAVGVALAAADPRIEALGLFAGTFVPDLVIEQARRLRLPVHMLLQWDDASGNRDQALRLFDALGSPAKTLQANTGGHLGTPLFAAEDQQRFLARHLT